MLGELTVRNSKDVDVPPGDLAAGHRNPGEQRHGRGFVNAKHRHLQAHVLVVAKEMIYVRARSSDVMPDVTNGLTPPFSALGCGGMVHVVLRYQLVKDGLVTLAETGKDFTYDVDRSAHTAPLASDA
jgi:hypothetical protein